MKLNKAEVDAIASHILSQITEKKAPRVTKEEEKSIDALLKKLNEKRKEIDVLQKEIDALKEAFKTEHNLSTAHPYKADKNGYISLIKSAKLAKTKIPSLLSIKNDIILKGLFTDEADMEAFMKELIAKYD